MRAPWSSSPSPALALTAACLAATASAALTSAGGLCFDACTNTLRTPHFADTAPGKSKLIAVCESELHIKSTYLCADLHCDALHRDRGLRSINETCVAYRNVSLPPFEIVAGYSEEEIAALRRLTQDEAADAVLDEVVLPAEPFYQIWYDSLVWDLSQIAVGS